MIKVSVVIPNYNGNEYLRNCIDALRVQEFLEFETIIIDNGSQDSSYDWIKSEYKEIIFKQLDKNYGFSKAVNEGIQIAEGEYILLLNNDTVVEKDFISQLIKAIERDKKIFAVSSKMIDYYNHGFIDDVGDEYTVLGWAYKRGDGKRVEQFNKSKRVFSACAGAALYRRKILEEIGLFDENFFAYLEDVDISYRARIYGYYNIYCPDAKVYHIGSATSGGRYNDFKLRLSGRNNIYLMYKNMPYLQILFNVPFLIMGTLVKLFVFSTKGYGKVYREGVIEAFRTIKQIQKVPFSIKHTLNYLFIEWLLIINTFEYFFIWLDRHVNKR